MGRLFIVGVGCLLLFAVGLLRDGMFTDALVHIDLSRQSAQRAEFRPWVPGKYVLSLMTDDREDRSEEEMFNGRVYVRIESADGQPRLASRYEPPALDHRLRGSVEYTPLAHLYINTPELNPWTMTVRVGVEDPAFSDARSSVVVQREKRIIGIEGLLNYAVAAPALILLALSVPAALGLPRRGGTWMPALLSVSGLAAIAAMVLAV